MIAELSEDDVIALYKKACTEKRGADTASGKKTRSQAKTLVINVNVIVPGRVDVNYFCGVDEFL